MLASCEASELFALLEGGTSGARASTDMLMSVYSSVRESWYVRGLLNYQARTGSTRVLQLLARAPEPHSRFILDSLDEQLRGEPPGRRRALAILAPLIARRPEWLHIVPQHQISRSLLNAARKERDSVPLVHAMLALAALLPAAPVLAATSAIDLADVILRPTMLEPQPSPAVRAHLWLAQLALFRTAYATAPCSLIETLRAEYAAARDTRNALEHAMLPLVESVRLHPALITSDRTTEADPVRWTRLEPHDVLSAARHLTLPQQEQRVSEASVSTPAPASATETRSGVAPSPPAGSGTYVARASTSLVPGGESWFALSERCGADSAPMTPLPADTDAEPELEAAVEATPENTPAKEIRSAFRFPTESSAVRALGRVESGVTVSTERSARLGRVVLERAAPPPVETRSPLPFACPEYAPLDYDEEDREVVELTTRMTVTDLWQGDRFGTVVRWRPGSGAALRLDPRVSHISSPARASGRRTVRPPRRPCSCPPRGLPSMRTCSVAVQTVDTWPEPYEFLIGDFYRNLPRTTPHASQPGPVIGASEWCPAEPTLEEYLSTLYTGTARREGGGGTEAELSEQLALSQAHLAYERWRREAHAERNRRLLGRCRQVRALELQCAALRDRVRTVIRERDELRARTTAPHAPHTPHPALQKELEEALTQLEAERALRVRAEAALRETELARSVEGAELERARLSTWEATRRVEGLALAVVAAERRTEDVRRLRRELLILAERDARLTSAAAAEMRTRRDSAQEHAERAMRASTAMALREAETFGTRAEAAVARQRELEAALAARDAAIAELKRNARRAADEATAERRALQDKYAALLRVVRRQEGERLRGLAGAERAEGAGRDHENGAVAGGSAGSATSAPQLESVRRVHSLVEHDEAASVSNNNL